MRQRCYNPTTDGYARYGGRGVRVALRWWTFEGFLADMGERSPGTSLDRINSNGHYEPGNCRWAPADTQQRNKRTVKLDVRKAHQIRWLVEMGYKQRAVARMYGVSESTVSEVVHESTWS